MSGQFFDAHSFGQIDFSGLSHQFQNTIRFFEAFVKANSQNDSTRLIDNVDTITSLLKIADQLMPITINDQQWDNSWVCSPYNSVVSYPLEELRHFTSRPLRACLSSLIRSIAPLLRSAKINRIVCVNNYLLSTNHHPDLSLEAIKWLTAEITGKFPDHAILFRSLNLAMNPKLVEALQMTGYCFAPSRQVYLFDPLSPDFLRRYNTVRDMKLLEDSQDYSVVTHEQLTSSDDDRLHELYGKLYLEKYSRHNPQFSRRLIKDWRESKMIAFTALRERTSGRLDGMIGMLKLHGVFSAPLVGYDTDLPRELGLYRRLMALALKFAVAGNQPLNLSAGAGEFKRIRGGLPTIEYSAVYCHHLGWKQRTAWKSLALLLNQVGARVLRRFRL